MTNAAEPPPLTVDDVGLLVADAVRLLGTLEAACVHLADPADPLPRGLLTAGEACRMVPAVLLLGIMLHPCLNEPGTLEEILRTADTRAAKGRPN